MSRQQPNLQANDTSEAPAVLTTARLKKWTGGGALEKEVKTRLSKEGGREHVCKKPGPEHESSEERASVAWSCVKAVKSCGHIVLQGHSYLLPRNSHLKKVAVPERSAPELSLAGHEEDMPLAPFEYVAGKGGALFLTEKEGRRQKVDLVIMVINNMIRAEERDALLQASVSLLCHIPGKTKDGIRYSNPLDGLGLISEMHRAHPLKYNTECPRFEKAALKLQIGLRYVLMRFLPSLYLADWASHRFSR